MNYWYLLVIHIFNVVTSFYLLRDLLWSIVWCDKGGKYNSFKKKVRATKWYQIIFLGYLFTYTNQHQRTFHRWQTFFKIYHIIQFFLLSLHLILLLTMKESTALLFISIFLAVLSFPVTVISIFQTDFHHNTKYDRERLQKKGKM